MPVFDTMPIFEKFIFLMGGDDPEAIYKICEKVFRCKKRPVSEHAISQPVKSKYQMPSSNNTLYCLTQS